MLERLAIATRRSRLALWQAEHVKAALQRAHPGLAVELLPLSTKGDELLDVSLAKEGGKGLFIKELEHALAAGKADLAVHSMKDLPAALEPLFTLAAITARDDARDVLVSPVASSLHALPAGAVVGTSSLRRQAQAAAKYPQLAFRALRGNVETRLAKLDRGEYAAIVLAAAGLKRLGLERRITAYLSLEESLPAPGQAALGIECLAARDDVRALAAALEDRGASLCVRAEREVSRALGGNCALPLAAHARLAGERIGLRALVASPDGGRIARAECEGPASEPEALGARAAELLRQRGATEILAALAP